MTTIADHQNVSDFRSEPRMPEALGWRRKPELDEAAREAWELPDGTLLLLDPTGKQDTLVR